MLNNLMTVTTSKAKQLILDALKVPNMGAEGKHFGFPVFLVGDAGCGKTHVYREIANELGWQVVVVLAMHSDPTEVGGGRGLPEKGGEFLRYFKPDWFKGIDPNKPALIIFDEITKAPNATQNAVYLQAHDRQTHAFEWGTHWVPMFTGNVQSARAGDLTPPGPMRNRVLQLMVKNSPRDWLENFAIPNNLHPLVTSCVKAHEASEAFPNGILNTWDAEENPAAFASERAWHGLSKMCETVSDPRPFAYMGMGNKVGNTFSQHCDLLDTIPDIESIIADPANCPVPDDMGTGFYCGNMVAYMATPETMPQLCTYIRRMPSEVAVTCMSEIIRRHPACKATRDYIAFKSDYNVSTLT